MQIFSTENKISFGTQNNSLEHNVLNEILLEMNYDDENIEEIDDNIIINVNDDLLDEFYKSLLTVKSNIMKTNNLSKEKLDILEYIKTNI